MEEQEGVEILNPNEEGVILPDVDDGNVEQAEEQDETNNQEEVSNDSDNEVNTEMEETPENTEIDEKESLKKALNAERKKRKELEKKLKADSKKPTKSTYDTLVEQGVDESLAKTLASAIDKPNERVNNLQFQNDMLKVSKKAGFADIENYADEVKSFVDKGLTIEQAYYAATGGIKKATNTKSEIRREVEAKLKNQKQKASMLDIDTTSTVAEPKESKLKYTSTELATAKAAGMSIEDYKAMQNMSSISEYERYSQSKLQKK